MRLLSYWNFFINNLQFVYNFCKTPFWNVSLFDLNKIIHFYCAGRILIILQLLNNPLVMVSNWLLFYKNHELSEELK